MSKCRSCGAKIIWTVTESGKRMPVDANPVPGGNIRLEHNADGEPPTAVYARKGEAADPDAPRQLGFEDAEGEVLGYVSHFATCPESRSWRKQERKVTA